MTNENAIHMIAEVDTFYVDAFQDVCMSYAISNYDKVMDEKTHESLSHHALRGKLLIRSFAEKSK